MHQDMKFTSNVVDEKAVLQSPTTLSLISKNLPRINLLVIITTKCNPESTAPVPPSRQQQQHASNDNKSCSA
jgi:hypothetical protein